MPLIIAKQSTARTVMVGPVLDADGVAVTGGVVGDFKISKNGGAPAALNGSATLTHRHTGHYSLALTASDLDTVGQAEIVIDDTVNACPTKEITVVEEVIYDALFAASSNAYAGAAGSTTLGSGAITATVIATGAIDADAIADGAIDAGALAADCITAAKIADGAIDAATFAAGAINAAAIATDAIDADAIKADAVTEIQSGLATAAALATVDGIVDDILLDTAEIGAAGAGLTNINLPNQTMDIVGNITGNLSGSVGSVTGLTASDVGAIKAKTDNLPSDPADASDIASSFTTVNSTLTTLGGYIDTEVASILAAVDTEVAAIKNKTDNLPASPAAVGSAMTLTSAYDLYSAEASFTRDQGNFTDEYTVSWFKNGIRQTSGITDSTIQVVKRADGSDLIASTAMTQIGSTGSYKYDTNAAANRITEGEAAIVVVSATIDGSTRTFSKIVGRDSTA